MQTENMKSRIVNRIKYYDYFCYAFTKKIDNTIIFYDCILLKDFNIHKKGQYFKCIQIDLLFHMFNEDESHAHIESLSY